MSRYLFRGLLVASFCFLDGGVAHAQASCPPGQRPYGTGNGLNMCGPDNSQPARRQVPLSPPPQWSTRWGAIAADAPKGILGVATDELSKQQAAQSAMSDCVSKGGGADCKIYTTYYNQCAAVVVGLGGFNTPSAGTVDEAVELGMKTCRDAGNIGCHTYYSACSLPARIQ